MTALNENRLTRAFAEGRKQLLPFLTAGYPDMETTAACLPEFEARGASICELGIAFSDPVADGPIIQASMTAALDAGATLAKVFEMVRAYRAGGGQMALLAMLSYSIVYRHGVEAFITAAAEAGFDGLIVPDLPLEESAELGELAAAAGLCSVMLISPTTRPDRRGEIARASSGFVYFMSVAGITGERAELPQATFDAVAELRQHTDMPVCIGFGISTPAMVAAACQAGDGAIVGSAIIHKINDARDNGGDRAAIVQAAGDFVASLLEPIR